MGGEGTNTFAIRTNTVCHLENSFLLEKVHLSAKDIDSADGYCY